MKVNRLLLNNIAVVGVGWGAYWMGAGGPGYLKEQWTDLLPLLESGALNPPISAVRPLAEAGIALADLEERRATGKIILTP